MTRLRATNRVRIQSIRLHGANGRVALVGARVYRSAARAWQRRVSFLLRRSTLRAGKRKARLSRDTASST